MSGDVVYQRGSVRIQSRENKKMLAKKSKSDAIGFYFQTNTHKYIYL